MLLLRSKLQARKRPMETDPTGTQLELASQQYVLGRISYEVFTGIVELIGRGLSYSYARDTIALGDNPTECALLLMGR